MAAAALILLVVVGGIALWGFLTDWTFSGLLPREGARCTPDKNEKDENAKEYVYDEDKKCTVVNRCKRGWEPNSSNTACISELTGDICRVDNSDPNGTYRYDTRGVCVSTCDSTTTEYDPTQDGKCITAENEIDDCPVDSYYKSITFKNRCGTKDVVTQRVDGGCVTLDVIKSRCNSTPGCIGFRHNHHGCLDMMLNANPACEHSSEQVYAHRPDHVLDQSGKLVGGGSDTYYMNNLCAADPDATYETWGDLPLYPVGGPCPGGVDEHKDACSRTPDCVGFKFNTDANRANTCSHFLRKKVVPTVGDPVKCMVNGFASTTVNSVYRVEPNNVLRLYPSTNVADSWDPDWGTTFKSIDCEGFTEGEEDMAMKSP